MSFTKSPQWKNFRTRILKDKNRCVICNTKKNPNLHHISYKRIFSKKNVIILCGKHHRLLHFITGEKVVKRDKNDVVSLKRAYNKMSIGKIRKLGLSIPIKDFLDGKMKESALYQYGSFDVPSIIHKKRTE